MIGQITEDTFEQFMGSLGESSSIDLCGVSFIDPYGMVGLLEIGETLRHSGRRGRLILPESDEVLLYLERMDFFRYAGEYFELDIDKREMSGKYLRSFESDVLLEITRIEKSDDIHFIVGRVRERAHSILGRHLRYDERAVNGFIVALSEVCQNIIEHSGSKGFVGIQKYFWKTVDKNVVKIAVMDIGRGFRQSLSERFSFGSDFEAIDKGLLHGTSRHADRGRGHGLTAVRRFVTGWNGRLSVRSGTAKLVLVPKWGRGKRREERLAHFPGAQVNIILPEV